MQFLLAGALSFSIPLPHSTKNRSRINLITRLPALWYIKAPQNNATGDKKLVSNRLYLLRIIPFNCLIKDLFKLKNVINR
jgi:hypothetical protein